MTMIRRYISIGIFALIALCLHAGIMAQPTPQVVFLWPAGHPTLQGASEKETIAPANWQPGQRINSIRNVHNPSIEVHLPPADKATGTAIVVAPGGGHQQLVWGSEGTDIAEWLNGLGVAAVILKYRLAQTSGYHYTVEGEALQDTQRAIRIVRARAKEWGVDPNRVGILGFSAGGALAALADIRFDRGKDGAADPIERESCRPDFAGLVYAGWAPMDITAPKDAAPAFLTSAGSDDQFHARETVEFYTSLFKAGVPSELHIYGHGGHGGGIKPRNGIPFGTWHVRFQEWLADLGMMKAGESGALPAEAGFVKLFSEEGPPKGWVVTEWNDLAKRAPAEGQWKVVDGVLHSGDQRGTWLMSEKEYGDFILEFEIKLTERGNSGLALWAPMFGDPAFDGMELQFADFRYNTDAKPNELTGAIYRASTPTKQVYRPTEWNRAHVELKGSHLTAVINGEKVQDIDLSTFDQPTKRHDDTNAPPLRDRPRRGHIGFQHLSRNNEPVLIRNVRIREIK